MNVHLLLTSIFRPCLSSFRCINLSLTLYVYIYICMFVFLCSIDVETAELVCQSFLVASNQRKNIPHKHKIDPKTINYTKWSKKFQRAIYIYIYIFHSMTLHNLPKVGFRYANVPSGNPDADAGWPDSEDFRWWGDCLLLGSFLLQERPNFWPLFSCGKRNVLIFYKNALGHILGDFDHKRIWSPWPWAPSPV
jgi:hypothetical protein